MAETILALKDVALTLAGNAGMVEILRGIDPKSSRANLDAMLAKAKALKIRVLLVALRAPGNYGPDFKAQFDAIYPDLAAKFNIPVTDNYFLPLIDQSTRLLSTDLMQADGLHPNAKGVIVAVKTLGPQVLDLLAKAGR